MAAWGAILGALLSKGGQGGQQGPAYTVTQTELPKKAMDFGGSSEGLAQSRGARQDPYSVMAGMTDEDARRYYR